LDTFAHFSFLRFAGYALSNKNGAGDIMKKILFATLAFAPLFASSAQAQKAVTVAAQTRC
jgi:hypothetical protein